MSERWSFPIPQAMQRHTGCRFVTPKDPSPPTVPDAGTSAMTAEPVPSIAPHEAEPARKD